MTMNINDRILCSITSTMDNFRSKYPAYVGLNGKFDAGLHIAAYSFIS